MKTDELKELGLTKEQIDAVFALNGKDIEKYKTLSETAEEKATDLERQLDDASTAISGFKALDIDSIKQKAADWETKYTADTAALQKQIADKDYSYAVREAVNGIKFSSESAKKAFVADASAAQLAIKDGKLLGFDDFKAKYAETDAAAFVSETDGNLPIFTKSVSSLNNQTDPDAALRAAMGLSTNEK
ncbi:MAG: phage scaffolding protein [Oscillospiraceae bacterium]